MTPFAPKVYICMLQLCRLSRDAAAQLYQKRLKLSAAFASGEFAPDDWPNDEAFVMSSLAEAGLSVAKLAEHAPDYTISGTFTFTKPMSARWLQSLPRNNALYHPVVGGDPFEPDAGLSRRARLRSVAAR